MEENLRSGTGRSPDAFLHGGLLRRRNGEQKEEGSSAADESMSQGSSDGSAESSQSDDYAEHMTLSVAVWGIGDTIIDGEDEVRDRLYDKFNIDIEPVRGNLG